LTIGTLIEKAIGLHQKRISQIFLQNPLAAIPCYVLGSELGAIKDIHQKMAACKCCLQGSVIVLAVKPQTLLCHKDGNLPKDRLTVKDGIQ